jgi:hypothetical protein
MFAFGNRPQPDGYEHTDALVYKMNKATINSIKIKNESLEWQKQMILNEASGMISGMQTELKNLKTQYDIKKSIIPHCEEL